MTENLPLKLGEVAFWNWLGQQFGIPTFEVGKELSKVLGRGLQENQKLKTAVSELIAENKRIATQNLILKIQLSAKDQKISEPEERLKKILGVGEQLKTSEVTESSISKSAPVKQSLDRFTFQWFRAMPLFIRGVILGAPGSGKSSTAHMLLEIYRWRRNPYVLGFPEEKKNLLPEWIGIAPDFGQIPPNSIVLVDEAYLVYHSRGATFDKNLEMSQAIGLARQRRHDILFVSHESRHLDKNILGYANFFIIKDPGAMQVAFERHELRDVVKRARESFEGIATDRREWAYVYSPEVPFEGLIRTVIPSYWSEELSQAYAHSVSALARRLPKCSGEEMKKQAKLWKASGWSYGNIAKMLGVSKSTIINWIKHNG